MTEPVLLQRRILVIKHGALGDFVLATGPMRAIRAHHLADHVVLLTTPPFVELATASCLFDKIWIDTRPGVLQVGTWLRLSRRLRGGGFHRVYDLQTSERSSLYFRFFATPKPEWSGIAPGASHRHGNPDRIRMHTVDRQSEQLRIAGILHAPHPDLSWAVADIRKFPLIQPYGLLAPGGSTHRTPKRWPPERFADLSMQLLTKGIQPVAVGSSVDSEAARPMVEAGALDLTGRTSLLELAEVAREADVAVGNDTGPMHIAATVGCRVVVLFSAASDPTLCAPRGDVRIMCCGDLAALPVHEVAKSALEG